jgi:transcriptional regulator
VVHAHGRIRFIDERAWVRDFVTALTARHESGRRAPWAVSDAPAAYLDRMLGAIVGFEIAVERLEGKFKSSQNRNTGERAGVVAGLSADGVSDDSVGLLVRPPA